MIELTPDILIFSNGGPTQGDILNIDEDEILKNINQHFISMNLIIKSFLPGMLKKKFGRIINISSTSSKQPINGLDISNFIRPGLCSLYKSLSNKYSYQNITFNTVSPGAIDTERLKKVALVKSKKQKISIKKFYENLENNIPMKRIGSAKEVANIVSFLASKNSSYITGANIPVDGGATKSF